MNYDQTWYRYIILHIASFREKIGNEYTTQGYNTIYTYYIIRTITL